MTLVLDHPPALTTESTRPVSEEIQLAGLFIRSREAQAQHGRDASAPVTVNFSRRGMDVRFMNDPGAMPRGRYRILPWPGSDYLNAGFPIEEIEQRISRSPAKFRIWDEDRPQTELGTIMLNRVLPTGGYFSD